MSFWFYFKRQAKKFFFLFLLSFTTLAEELSHPFFLSQGGSGGASLREDTSYLLNPALLGFQKRTKGAISYSFKKEQQTIVGSFLDLKTKLPIALTYQRTWSKSFRQSKENTLLIHSGLRISPYLSLGVSLKREIKVSNWNLNLGSALKLSPHLGLAVFLDKVLEKEKAKQRILSGALYHQWRNFFSSQVDLSRTEQKEWILKGGLRSLFHPYFSAQVGGRTYFDDKMAFNKIKKYFLSGGFSFHSPKFFLEYAIEKDTQKIYQHSITLLIKI
ncbi:MAG: hypothetical protein OXC37_00750 [Bdellovibrionaceae bacterium]|nr:hypothetical protein [Pseudobdellovibrionaceae bacterium]